MKLSSLRHTVLLLAFAAAPVLAQDVASASSEGPKFGKWETRVLAGSGKEVIRTAVWSTSGKTLVSLDAFVDDCRTVSFGMAWVRATPADHDLYLKNVATTLQVDKHPVVPFLSTFELSKGEVLSALTLAEIDDFGAAVDQMEQGRTLQVRVPWDVDTRANDILEDYPLKGFSDALAWTRKTCWDIANQRSAGKSRGGQPLP